MRRFTYKSSNFNMRNTALFAAFFTRLEVVRGASLQSNEPPATGCNFSRQKIPADQMVFGVVSSIK